MNSPKPCPFCGHSVKVLSYQEKSTDWKVETHIECRTSGCFGANVRFVSEWGEDPEAFIEKWNARATAEGGGVKVIDHSKYAPDCTCCDDWGKCTTCGQPTGSADLWQDTCPRCAEIAALEAEIGRAYCYQAQAINARSYQLASDRLTCNILTDAAVYAEKHADALLTRYRALLAAGADAAQQD